MQTKQFSHIGKLLLWVMMICALTQFSSKNDVSAKYPEDLPMPEFITGTWGIISVTDIKNGNPIEVSFPIVRFSNETHVDFGESLATYKFIASDLIAVEDPRRIGVETWRLERKGDQLIIYGAIDKNRKYILERCKGWLSKWLAC